MSADAMAALVGLREALDALEEACFNDARSRRAAVADAKLRARAAVDARLDGVARRLVEAESFAAEVARHAKLCPVGYRSNPETGALDLWIPDDRPDRGLQHWLRELDEMVAPWGDAADGCQQGEG